jgi:hypothetical protein
MKIVLKRDAEDEAGGKSLDLAEAIKEFYRDFPEHKKDVFILNHQKFATGKEAVADIAPALDAVKAENPAAKLPFAKSMAMGMFEGKLPCSVNIGESMMNNKPDSKIFARIVIPAGDEFSAKLMKSIFVSNDPVPNANFPVMDDKYNNTEMWHRYVLDHELGHAVTQLNTDKQAMKVSSLGNRAECEADAYAMIRHYQRYGADSTFPEYVAELRNINAVQKGDVVHWTTRAVDEVIELNRQGKLADLTPQQARDLSVEIAKRCHLSADAEHNMGEAFKSIVISTALASKNKTGDGERVMKYLEQVAELGAETNSPGVLEVCRRYMSTIETFIPAGLPQERGEAALKLLTANITEMNTREEPKTEPVMGGLKRAFRDAIIDAQSGVNDNKPSGDNKLPKVKKPKGPGF